MNRLRHDAAVAVAQANLNVVASQFPPSSHKDLWEQFYRIALAGLEALAIQEERMQQRLRPSRN